MYKVIALDGHTLMDICIQEYGSISMLFTLWLDNRDNISNLASYGLNGDLSEGDELNIRLSPEGVNKAEMEFFRTKQIKVKTGPIV